MALNLATFAFALKQYYTKYRIENLVYKDNPFLAMIRKNETFVGTPYMVPIIYGDPQGRSATFATAQANKTSTQGIKWSVATVHDYGLADIDNETMLASANDEGAFMRAATTEINNTLQGLGRSAATAMFRDGGGSIGQVTSGMASLTITLLNINDVVNFEKGMTIAAAVTAANGTPRAGTAVITGIDRDAGTLTTSGSNWSTQITSLSANDFLFVSGDQVLKMNGLQAHMPNPAPLLGDSFYSVDRSVDAVRLAGVLSDGRGKPASEAWIDALARSNREGGRPDVGFCSYERWADLEKDLGSKVMYVDAKPQDTNFGFRGLRIQGPKTPMDIFPDQNCSFNDGWGLQMDTWELISRGPVPRLLTYGPEGLEVLRNPTSDSVEVRCGYYANMACHAPGWNFRLQLG